MHGMGRIKKSAFRSFWDSAEYFLRSMVFVCPGERRMEKRNARGYVSVYKCGSSSGRAATGGKARPGGPLGAGVIRLFRAWSVALAVPRAQRGRRRVTDTQQVIPSTRSAGRGFHAYSAKHLDMLTARAGLAPDERLGVRGGATGLPLRANSYVI